MTEANRSADPKLTLLDVLDRCGCPNCGQMAEEAAKEIRRLNAKLDRIDRNIERWQQNAYDHGVRAEAMEARKRRDND